MHDFYRLTATGIVWFMAMLMMLIFFAGYEPQSDLLAGFALLFIGGIAAGATAIIWDTADEDDEYYEKPKRKEQSRVDRLAALMEDEDIEDLEAYIARRDLEAIQRDY